MAVTAQTLFIEPCPPVLSRRLIKLDRDGVSLIMASFEDTGYRIGQRPILNRFSERPFCVCDTHQGTRGCLRAEKAGRLAARKKQRSQSKKCVG
jgi:hypothetical protein